MRMRRWASALSILLVGVLGLAYVVDRHASGVVLEDSDTLFSDAAAGDRSGLKDLFPDDPTLYGKGNGDSYEWPFVWSGEDGAGDRSGWDWLGSETSMSARGLRMPPDWDDIGHKYPSRYLKDQELGSHDEMLPAGYLPGGAYWPYWMARDNAVRENIPTATQQHQAPLADANGQYGQMFNSVNSQQLHGVSYTNGPSNGQLNAVKGQQLRGVSYTDYGMGGAGVKCTCDSDSAGDEEMEGLDKRVKPACTCTGGRLTTTTRTEEGGPLDTGIQGAWPQGMPETVSKIDGGSQNAYKSPISQLSGNNSPVSPLSRRANTQVHAEQLRTTLLDEESRDQPRDQKMVPVVGADGLRQVEKGGKEEDWTKPSPRLEYFKHEIVGEEGLRESHPEDTPGLSGSRDEHESDMHKLLSDPTLGPLDRHLVHRMAVTLRQFTRDTDLCERVGQECAHGKMCLCNKRAGMKLCYRMEMAFRDCTEVPHLMACATDAMKQAHKVCDLVEKLPGVNIDNDPMNDYMEPRESQSMFWTPKVGVYN